MVYVVTRGGTVHALDAASGGVEWSTSLDRADGSHRGLAVVAGDAPAFPDGVGGDAVVAPAGNGRYTTVLDRGTGAVLHRADTGSVRAAPVVTDGGVLVARTNGGIGVLGRDSAEGDPRYAIAADALSAGDAAVYAVRWTDSSVCRIA